MPEIIRTRKAKALTALAALGALAGASWGLTFTPLFEARTVTVQGEQHLSEAQVLSIAGLEGQTNVFHLDTEAIEMALEADPWVLDAQVAKDLPSKVAIGVTERNPILATTDGHVVAGDGVVLPGASVDGLPLLEGRSAVSEEDRIAAASALQAMAPVVRAKVRSLTRSPGGDLLISLRSGVMVQWGSPGEDVEKAAALRAVLVWAAQQQLTLATIDVAVPDAPTANLPGGAQMTP